MLWGFHYSQPWISCFLGPFSESYVIHATFSSVRRLYGVLFIAVSLSQDQFLSLVSVHQIFLSSRGPSLSSCYMCHSLPFLTFVLQTENFLYLPRRFVLLLLYLMVYISTNFKMSQSGNTFCSFSCVLEISEPPSSPGGLAMEIPAAMYGTLYPDVPILSRPDIFTIKVNFFNALGAEFPLGSLVLCQGTLVVIEGGSVPPILSVRATTLVW